MVNVQVHNIIQMRAECTVMWNCDQPARFMMMFEKENGNGKRYHACDKHAPAVLNEALLDGKKSEETIPHV